MNKNKYVIEGPDGSGKSALCYALSLATQLPLIDRHVSSKEGPRSKLWEWVENDNHTNHMGIYDRHPLIGEYIYGPIVRGFIDPDFKLHSTFAAVYRMRLLDSATLIICLPPLSVVTSNVESDKDNQLSGILNYQSEIYNKYVELARDLNALVWDYTHPQNFIRRING